MFRIVEWLLLFAGFWRIESVRRKKIVSVPANVPVALSPCSPLLATDTFGNDRASKEILISWGLSELTKKKTKVNRGRRKEDQRDLCNTGVTISGATIEPRL
jgi:hypothetical protein